MWRAFFWSLGLFACLLGLQCMVIDKAVLKSTESVRSTIPGLTQTKPREFVPPEWAPWSLMSLGAITILYSITLRRGGD